MANSALYVTADGQLTTVSSGNTAVYLDATGGLTTVNTGDVAYWGVAGSAAVDGFTASSTL